MEQFTKELVHLIVTNWAMIFILLIPSFRKFLKSLQEFVQEMKKLSKETHIILQKCEERLSKLEETHS